MDKLRMETLDMVQKNIEAIGALFPNCVTEARGEDGAMKRAVNFDMLRQMLTDEAIAGDEAYEFTWVGKKEAMVEASRPIRKTLRPCKEGSKDWDTTENLYIEGDNLDVLKLLQESYLGKVKMIYIDPPYNTGHDFIYRDNYARSKAEEERQMGMFDEETEEQLFENTESNGRFHSDWCSMMYPRLMIARNLLSKDGLIFISINENEQVNLEKICDEVFGANNHVATFVWKNKYGPGAFTKGVAYLHEYILCYAKNYPMNVEATLSQEEIEKYKATDERYSVRGGYITQPLATRSKDDRPNLVYPLKHNGIDIWPDKQWIWEKSRLISAYEKGEIVINEKNGKYSVRFKQYLKDENGITRKGKPLSILTMCFNQDGTKEMEGLLGRGIFDFPKPKDLIKYFLSLRINEIDDKDFLVMDFFSGSATTADAVMQINAEDGGQRQFIMVQWPENIDKNSVAGKAGYRTICDIGKERIRRAGKKIKSEAGLLAQNLDVGFRVLKLDESNMKDVYYSAAAYTQEGLSAMESNIKEDRSDLDLLYGCLLAWALPLSLPYCVETIDGCTVHTYGTSDPAEERAPLKACFDEQVPESVVRAIAAHKPLRVVFRDSSFASSPERINVEEIFKLLAPNTSVRVI